MQFTRRTELTCRQQEILDFIQAQPIPPTIREIGTHFGIKSPNGVVNHLNALLRKGYITRDTRRSRGIHVSSLKIPQGALLVTIDSRPSGVTITISPQSVPDDEVSDGVEPTAMRRQFLVTAPTARTVALEALHPEGG